MLYVFSSVARTCIVCCNFVHVLANRPHFPSVARALTLDTIVGSASIKVFKEAFTDYRVRYAWTCVSEA